MENAKGNDSPLGSGHPPGTGAEFGQSESGWRTARRIGGMAALVSLLLSLATMVALITVGGPPETAEEAFALLQNQRFVGLLRNELLSLLNVAMYYLTFFGLYAALRRSDSAHAALSTALVYAGVTLWIASHSLLALVTLSDRYAAASTETQRSHLLAAGEALMAADMWHGTGALVGGLLVECGAILISVVMLRSTVFNKATAYVGLVTHGLDLTQILVGLLVPAVKVYVMAVAGPLYLVWFALIGRRLLQLSHQSPEGRR
jgi:hypothetical protein